MMDERKGRRPQSDAPAPSGADDAKESPARAKERELFERMKRVRQYPISPGDPSARGKS